MYSRSVARGYLCVSSVLEIHANEILSAAAKSLTG